MNRLPNYLARPDTDGNTFGTLRLEISKKGQPLWVIEAEAHVVILAKRLYPGAAGRGPGLATLRPISEYSVTWSGCCTGLISPRRTRSMRSALETHRP